VKTMETSRNVSASFIACELEEKESSNEKRDAEKGFKIDAEWGEGWNGYKNESLKRHHLDQDKYKEKALKLKIELRNILDDNCERLSDAVTNQVVLWALYKGVDGFMEYQKVSNKLEKKKPFWDDDSDSQ